MFSFVLVSMETIYWTLKTMFERKARQKSIRTRRIVEPFSMFGNVVKQGHSCLLY